ncbi:unnamed protein product (macronuclear) [Paramecium tetraurelia]|uniref:Chromosome undetermined scaffold_141, whole genome shotgun sequence n=1 Tax=Paramecium tetraurelia TaxID=5888 RepID=Q3SDA5_PARTE|nr:uncharacterized protein GSPATT00034034001 [Paramecium tetraurelia]CAI44458.1 Mini antigen [Paramecium tetraurelia]CAK64558.1 unnamed protein product [Paramecium tetraurelia]|eukprot:XP_001431956.1 hypothetical protein (macronuclear) [Paramecium tetraurelia strain d4-2]
MKSYILLAILIGLGASQIVVTSQTLCGCPQLTNQNDCDTLPGCQWQANSNQCTQSCQALTQTECQDAAQYCQWNPTTTTCSTFLGCANLIATNNQQCVQQNPRCVGFNYTTNLCLNYNEITSPCANYPQTQCNFNFGTDGVCYFTGLVCSPYNNCTQAQQQQKCLQLNAFGNFCVWSTLRGCQAITSCGQLSTQASCTNYFSSFQSKTLNVCYWQTTTNPPSCVPITNLNNLDQTTCLVNTSFFFRWYGLSNNPGNGFCGPCKQFSLKKVVSTQCSCSQYVLQNDCNSQSTLCQWNTLTNTCSPNTCAQIKTQNICLTVSGCYWSIGANQCQALTSCNDLTFKVSAVGCAAQSLYCAGYQGGQCVQTSTVASTCNSQITASSCYQFINSQGLCVWNVVNQTCSQLLNCSQITDSALCGNQQNQCMWDATSLTCQQLTCASFTTSQTCTYVQTEFGSNTYQLCRWNKSQGILGVCENAYSALQQTSTTCVSNTGNNFRWSTNNASAGMCVSCGTNQLQLQTPSSCQCSQFHSKSNCQNSGFCTFNAQTNICSPSPCTQYENQITCAGLSTCYWSANGCLAFTNCSSLPAAANQLECVSMNASCKGISNGVCQSFASTTCAAQYAATNTCVNNSGTDGICYLVKADKTTTCVGFSQCTQAANNETLCLRNQLSCSWNSLTETCSQVTCSSFKSELNCKFYLPNPLSSQIVPCFWNTTNGTCGPASDILTALTQNNCATSTHNTYTWVTTSAQTGKGYCVRCQQQVTLPKQCACSFLTQYDCSQALECYWNNGACIQMECTSILQQSVCASQKGCQWNNNSCTVFNGTCTNLFGQSQAACMAQNIYCVGSNGTNCTTTYAKCEANTTDTSCVASIGSNGACYWNTISKTCVAVNSCNQLPEAECNLQSKSCYWNGITCQSLTCSTLYSQYGQCTFVMKLSSNSYVSFCQMVGDQCTQVPDAFSLTQEQCYANTNKTARWIPQSTNYGGICALCSGNVIPNYNPQTCQCFQYMTQSDCNNASGQSCYWSTNNICAQQVCANIVSQSACAQNIACIWNAGTCQTFTSCSQVAGTGLTAQQCLSYSIQCKGYNGGTCTSTPNYTCSTLLTPSACSGNYGSDGACLWNSTVAPSVCIPITNCSQIPYQQICGYYTEGCQFVNNQCQSLTCGYFTTPATCTFYVSQLYPGQIQQCQWSAATGTCVNFFTSSDLNSGNCAANTGFTYRWVPTSANNGDGYCTKCMINSVNVPGQCACNQLIYQNDCLANSQCSWSTTATSPSCYNKPCSQIMQQAICSTNPRCSWSAAQNLCQPFSSCSELAGVNAGECASYSVFCAAISTTYLPLQNKYLCAGTQAQCTVSNPSGTAGATTPSKCENTYVTQGICQFDAETKQCNKITQCSGINSQQKCQQFNRSCYWQLPTGAATAATCVPASCTYFTNQQTCTYYLTSLTTSSSSKVVQCSWQPTGSCIEATNLSAATSKTCYSNSFMMSRWTSTQAESPNGFCASCSQYSLTQTYKSVCSCSELSQYECQVASPQCAYNSTSTKCAAQNCTSITSKFSCAANPSCIYIGSCQTYTKTPTGTNVGCVNITSATSSFDCLTASANCPQFTASATQGNPGSCGVRQECSKQTTQALCEAYNAQVFTGYCTWNGSACQNINNCKQISDVSACNLQTSRCQWSVVLNSCITQSCNSYTSQADCTYVYTSYQPGDIALCAWDPAYNECRSAPLSNLDSTQYNQTNTIQCFVNTGHVYHLDGNECTRCFQNILSILLITMLLILI